MDYPPSELVLDGHGHVYHLGITREHVADTVLLVGDQGRVAQISRMFDSVEHRSQHREFVCHTGVYRGTRISALSTGIGTDNIDIAVNELDAAFNIDLGARRDEAGHTPLRLIRIGTCGILQPDVPVHSYILSGFAYGLDNVAHFYPLEFSELEKEIAASLTAHLELPGTIQPYCKQASAELFDLLSSEATFAGINVTSSGFYGPQGRRLRLGLRNPDINERLTAYRFDLGGRPLRVMNFEMESSALFALGQGLGHQTVTICLGIANRPTGEFTRGYEGPMNELIQYVLDRVAGP